MICGRDALAVPNNDLALTGISAGETHVVVMRTRRKRLVAVAARVEAGGVAEARQRESTATQSLIIPEKKSFTHAMAAFSSLKFYDN